MDIVLASLILSFLASLIPSFREYFKKELRKTYIFLGASLIITESILNFYVFPKVINLYKTANLVFHAERGIPLLALGFLLSLVIFILGIKIVGYYKSSWKFYGMFALLILLTYSILEIIAYTIIDPINVLMTNLN